jgi:hypothetical protein
MVLRHGRKRQPSLLPCIAVVFFLNFVINRKNSGKAGGAKAEVRVAAG